VSALVTGHADRPGCPTPRAGNAQLRAEIAQPSPGERPALKQKLGLRDRAILERLYATGMLRTELIGLSILAHTPTRFHEIIV